VLVTSNLLVACRLVNKGDDADVRERPDQQVSREDHALVLYGNLFALCQERVTKLQIHLPDLGKKFGVVSDTLAASLGPVEDRFDSFVQFFRNEGL
jgi:hypothetical protein